MNSKKHDADNNKPEYSQSIIAKFGSTIQNVTQVINNQVDERILKRLGFEQRIGFLLVYGLVTITTLLMGLWLRNTLLPKAPARMTGTFNIAVAAFDTANTNIFNKEDGVQIGEWIVDQLRSQKQSFPTGSVVVIWGPGQTGTIEGKTREERATKAQALAEKINASIIIHGSLQNDNDFASLNPEFFVVSKDFNWAQEITGLHQLGTPIEVPEDLFSNPVFGAEVNRELYGRTLSLAHLTIGLIYFRQNNYNDAFTAFSEAENTPGWESKDGKEVIYLFLGNAALNLKEYDTASNWFEKALDNNPNYSRAYIGFGFNRFQQSILGLKQNRTVDLDLMDQAINVFNQGLKSTDKPPNADVDAKAHFGLGRAYLTLSVLDVKDLWVESENELRYITEAYEAGKVNSKELAAQAYGNLGLLHYSLGNYDEAIHVYEQALNIGNDPEFNAEWTRGLSRIYRVQGNDEKAAEYEAQAAEYEAKFASSVK
jgi:tetratricopeptide (TPR) repeat protein